MSWSRTGPSILLLSNHKWCAPNVYRQDAFTFNNGSYTVADAPGLGLEMDEEAFQSRYAANEAKISL